MSVPSGVRTIRPPVAGTRLTQTRMFIAGPIASGADPAVVRIEQRRAAGDRDGDRVSLAEVLDGELRTFLCLVRREVGHQEVLPDGRAGSGRGHVRPAALGVDD